MTFKLFSFLCFFLFGIGLTASEENNQHFACKVACIALKWGLKFEDNTANEKEFEQSCRKSVSILTFLIVINKRAYIFYV